MKRFIGLIMVAVLSSCSLVSRGEQSQPEIERNVLTGLPGSNGKVLAVKFDDTVYAHPQEGIEFADVVFVTQVEAGLTRVMGIYSSNYLKNYLELDLMEERTKIIIIGNQNVII